MQLHIEFLTDMLNLPVSYNTIVQGFIYNTLQKADPVYSEKIHNKGSSQRVNLPKQFVFGRLGGEYTVHSREIIFPHRASLEIRSTDNLFIEKLMSGIEEGETVKLGTNYVRIAKITAENKKITENTVSAFCLSPFVYRVPFPECNFFDADAARYQLLNNARQKWQNAGLDASDFELDVEFSDVQPKKAHAVFKNTFIIAWDTAFTINGNSQIIDFLYNTGIGKRNSQGFGMFGVKQQ